MHKEKINLLGFSHESLVDFFQSIDQPSFRAPQLMKWVHQRGVIDFMLMTDFSLALRNQLSDYFKPYNEELEELLEMKFNWD